MGDNQPLDHALAAVREALATAHDPSQMHIGRTTDPDCYITITHRPSRAGNSDQDDRHSAYTATLHEAGWEQAVNLGPLVLIPNIPPADTEPGTHIATWAATIDDIPDPVDAAFEARALQHESDLTEAVWKCTDASGRRHVIVTDDNHGSEPEPEHDGRLDSHLTAHDHRDTSA